MESRIDDLNDNLNEAEDDIDSDDSDIIDTDGDGQVDTCIYGGTYPSCLAGSANASTTAATIWGYVFEDTNGNGVRNTGEPTPSGVVVSLKSEDGSTDLGPSQTYNGLYSFAQLSTGQSYLVGITPPSGYVVTSSNDVIVKAEVLVPNKPVRNFVIAPSQ